MQSSTYTCSRWVDLQSQYIAPMASGITGQATLGEATSIELDFTDDVFIRGIEVITDSALPGSKVTIQILNPYDVVIGTPVTNWNIPASTKMLSYESAAPQKGLAGWTLKIIYTPPSIVTVNFSINFMLLKILV